MGEDALFLLRLTDSILFCDIQETKIDKILHSREVFLIENPLA